MASVDAGIEAALEASAEIEATGFAVIESSTEKVLVIGSEIASKSKEIIGSVWLEGSADAAANLNAGVHGEAGFVVVGEGGVILHSPDGSEWEIRTHEAEASFGTASELNGSIYVVGSLDGAAAIQVSADGETWKHSGAEAGASFKGIAESNGKLVAVGSKSESEVDVRAH